MTRLREPAVRIALVGLVVVAVVGSLGWSGSLRDYDGVLYEFLDVAVGETVYAAVADAQGDLTIRRVWVDVVGPIEVEPVRCPGVPLGSSRDCTGGPIPAVGRPIDVDPAGLEMANDAIVGLAITRVGEGPAAVCGTRMLHTAGLRVGIVRSDAQIEFPGTGTEPSDGGAGIADRLCG